MPRSDFDPVAALMLEIERQYGDLVPVDIGEPVPTAPHPEEVIREVVAHAEATGARVILPTI